MKKLAPFLLVLCATAWAQSPSNPALKASAGVNPFTGKPLTVEQIQRELEEAKLRTAMLEEVLKQSNLQEELTAVPVRKSVEIAQARTAIKREEVAAGELQAQQTEAAAQRAAEARMRAAQVAKEELEVRQARQAAAERAANERRAAARKRKAELEAAKQAKLTPSLEAAQAAPVRQAPRVTLTSVMALGNKRSAVLDVDGEVMVVEDGATTRFGVLRVMGGDQVELNGHRLAVPTAGVSRFVVSDPKPTGPQSAGGTTNRTVSAPVGLPTTAAVPAAVSQLPPEATAGSSTGQPAAAPRSQLPPLQLPPGLTVLPSSTR